MPLTNAPVLTSENLTLRGPEMHDFEPLARFYADGHRAQGFGGTLKRDEAWRWFASNIGYWHIHSYGYFTIETQTGEIAGISGIWNPEGWPEPEVGWVVHAGFEGRGIAYEAACRTRRWAYDDLGMTTLTSNILANNARSIKLAKRMGAKYERSYTNPNMGE
ncbi:MAG: GNAT family N-acetyltransferase, partial [Paracoccaceae bacterium]|nr:GNAT family N-acetyltransferase [Paracoccaceae bacterium]